MKPLLNIIVCASLLIAVGCGKSNSSGGSSYNNGGSTYNNPYNNPYNGNVPVTSQQPLQNFQNWYNSSAEGSFPGIGQRTETRKITKFDQTDGCESQPISIFGLNLGSFNYCFSSSSQASSQNVQRIVNVLVSQNKSQNLKLAQAYSGSGMVLANISEGMGMGKVYQLEYQKTNGHRVVYIIDTGINSAFNPVRIIDSEARTDESVTSIN